MRTFPPILERVGRRGCSYRCSEGALVVVDHAVVAFNHDPTDVSGQRTCGQRGEAATTCVNDAAGEIRHVDVGPDVELEARR